MDTDSHTELGWLWLSVFCSVHGESVLEYITEVKAAKEIPWQMGGWNWFCQRDFSQANERQRHLKEKPVSEFAWGGGVHSNQLKKY